MYNHMVVHLEREQQMDRMFHALADSTRRDILRRVVLAECSVSALANRYTMSFAAVQKHVAVLERASIVTKTRRGREQLVRANIHAVRDAARVLGHFEELWRGRVDRMNDVLAETSPTRKPSTKKGKQQ